jgi:NAD+ kinase
MKRIGLVVHGGREAAVKAAHALTQAIRDKGAVVYALRDDVADLPAELAENLPHDLDVVLVLGGDGTLLRAIHLVGPGPAILGINFGHLGFLTATASMQTDALLNALESGPRIDERSLLDIEGLDGERYALNDLVLEKTHPGRAIRIRLEIGQEQFITWTTDGVIAATPTGSTAYSFSAGGPLVSPEVACMIVTPVSPHGLFDRSLVVGAHETLRLTVADEGPSAAASVDGRPARELSPGTSLTIRMAEKPARLARLDDVPFWSRVRDKLRVSAP